MSDPKNPPPPPPPPPPDPWHPVDPRRPHRSLFGRVLAVLFPSRSPEATR